jgi:hypothetical protein
MNPVQDHPTCHHDFWVATHPVYAKSSCPATALGICRDDFFALLIDYSARAAATAGRRLTQSPRSVAKIRVRRPRLTARSSPDRIAS